MNRRPWGDLSWEDERGWVATVRCDYCREPVWTTGPEQRGTRAAVLVDTDVGVIPFCSRACMEAWSSLGGLHARVVADEIGPDQLAEVMPPGANDWTVDWPDD